MHDYGARWKPDWYFTTVDPLAEKYYSISPYAYVANNPLKFIDPDGKQWLNWKDREYAESLVSEMANKINTDRVALDNAYQARELATGDALTQIDAQIETLNSNINDLTTGITELQEMHNAEQIFTYKQIGGSEGSAENKNGIITMKVTGIANGIHESSHGYDLLRSPTGEYGRDNYLDGEVKAYGRQHSYNSSTLPASYVGRAASRNDINHDWVIGIQNSSGVFIYVKKLMQNAYDAGAVRTRLNNYMNNRR
jgi:hypothetical protein